ncbi:hypothetical protein MUG78_17905 [Gordonia alkaliphila]|uniref:hypothetical protein n=1 Tax=Gordonia alkaliphila TaxID=1053547 RepID=UPI001FF6E097|nr:hypothetical protein [Gordonia alkaliphila]MCK0441277.1 hypothetical protein [Gordonia alkaliphila]
MTVRTDVSGIPLTEGMIAQLILDPGVGTRRERAVGVITHLDENSSEYVWFSPQYWWNIYGDVDWTSSQEPVRTHTSLLFQIAEVVDTDAAEVIAGNVVDCPPPARIEELREIDSVAASMWDDRTRTAGGGQR